MASKFMSIKRLIIPLVTVVLLASQLSGCAFMTSNELVEMLDGGQSITIEVANPSTYEIVSEVGSRQQSISWVQLDQLDTFPTFRTTFDKQLNIERRTLNGVNTKIGCIYIDADGDTNGNTTLNDATRNKVFMEKYYDNGDTKTALKKLAATVYTDVNGEDYHSFLATFNAYYNLLPDNINPDAFNATQSVTRERFAAALYRATNPVSQDYLTGFNGAEDEFTLQMGALTDYTAMAKQMDAHSFINFANKSLDHANIGSSITRAEAIYMVVSAEFPEQLASVTGKEKVSYTDVKNAGDLALNLGYKVRNKEAKRVDPKERWEAYTLYSMLQNPDKGVQGDIYKALVVADKYSLLDVTKENQCRWDEPISKAEVIQLLINIGSAQNNIYGYATDKAIGNENLDKYGKVAVDANVETAEIQRPEAPAGGVVEGIPPPVNVEDFSTDDKALYDELKALGLSDEDVLEAMAGDGLGGVEGMGGIGGTGSGSFDTPSSNIDEPVAPPVVTPPSSQATTPKSPSGLTKAEIEAIFEEAGKGLSNGEERTQETPGDGKAQDVGGYSPLS